MPCLCTSVIVGDHVGGQRKSRHRRTKRLADAGQWQRPVTGSHRRAGEVGPRYIHLTRLLRSEVRGWTAISVFGCRSALTVSQTITAQCPRTGISIQFVHNGTGSHGLTVSVHRAVQELFKSGGGAYLECDSS